MTSRRYYIFLLIFSIFFTLFGLVFVFIPTNDLWRAFKAENWATTEGMIVRSEIHRAGGKATIYLPFIQYSYRVGKKDYSSDKVTFSHFASGKETADEIVAKYPEGSQVEVYYSPENPEQSVLDNKVPYYGNIGGIIIGLVFSVSGLVLIFFSVRYVRKSKIVVWTS